MSFGETSAKQQSVIKRQIHQVFFGRFDFPRPPSQSISPPKTMSGGTVAAEPSKEAMKIFKRVKLRGKKKLAWALFKVDQKTQQIVPG
jgi:hypothetical protein